MGHYERSETQRRLSSLQSVRAPRKGMDSRGRAPNIGVGFRSLVYISDISFVVHGLVSCRGLLAFLSLDRRTWPHPRVTAKQLMRMMGPHVV